MSDDLPAGTPVPVPPAPPLAAPGAVDVPSPPKPKGSLRVRRIAVVVLVILTTLGFTASLIAVWSYRQVLNTSVFTERVETVISDPEVVDALALYITDEVFEAINPEQLAANALPDSAQSLVRPLVAAYRTFVLTITEKVLARPEVQSVVVDAVELAHRSAIKLIEGEKVAGFQIDEGDAVVMNTLPVIQQVLTKASEEGIFGRTVDIPPITDASGQPSEQITALATRLGVELPPDFGQLTVLRSDSLEEAQQALKLVRRGLWLLLIGTLVLSIVTLLLSTNRWRTFAQLGIGLAVAMLITRVMVNRVNQRVLDLVKNPDNLPAIRAIDASFFSTLDSLVLVLIVVGFVVAGIGYFFGRSDSAARLRASTTRQAVRAGATVQGASNPVSAFVVGHTDASRLVALGIGVVIVLWSGFTTSGIIIALVVTAVLLLVIELLVRRASRGMAAAAADDPAVSSDVGAGR